MCEQNKVTFFFFVLHYLLTETEVLSWFCCIKGSQNTVIPGYGMHSLAYNSGKEIPWSKEDIQPSGTVTYNCDLPTVNLGLL